VSGRIYGTRQKRAHSHPSRRRLVDLDSRLELGRASVVRAVVGAGPGAEDIQKARELFEARGAVVPVQDDRRHRSSPLSELFDAFEPFGFAMIHRSWAVNLRRVREIRPAADSGWEVKLDPPVNRVLPVSRRRVSALWECFAE